MADLIHQLKGCNRCSLRCNQAPLVDVHSKKSKVLWLGLSAVKVSCVQTVSPLSACTRSGKVLAEIEEAASGVSFYKTNIVKCLPLKDNKIRYPFIAEMNTCFHNLELELATIEPKIVFLLGTQVSGFVAKKFGLSISRLDEGFNYQSTIVDSMEFVPVHHPSYVLIYKRKKLHLYRQGLLQIIKASKHKSI